MGIPESVSVKPVNLAKMPGSIAGYGVSFKHRWVNSAGISLPTKKPETEAFRASEGLNASRIQVKANHLKYWDSLNQLRLNAGARGMP